MIEVDEISDGKLPEIFSAVPATPTPGNTAKSRPSFMATAGPLARAGEVRVGTYIRPGMGAQRPE